MDFGQFSSRILGFLCSQNRGGSRKGQGTTESRGQGATEYLVILGAVLLVSLVTVGVLSASSSSAAALKEQQSSSYWKSATPFSISTYTLEKGILVASIKNQLNEPLKLTSVQINDNGTAMTVWTGRKCLVLVQKLRFTFAMA
ncbi:MAG: hypothetical protein WC408_05955 [Candidatus Micrarchaeia archaeon]